MHRHLITTADESTWKLDCPVIFLGEWCRLYQRKKIWQHMDAIIADPYGLELSKKDADYLDVCEIQKKIFPKLVKILNQHHKGAYTERFWLIVIGHWLERYVRMMINRIKTLEQCLQNHQISGTLIHDVKDYSLVTQDSQAAIWSYGDDRWNNILSGRIIDLLGYAQLITKISPVFMPLASHQKSIAERVTFKKILLWGWLNLTKILHRFVGENDAFMINTYLPKFVHFRVQLAFRQIPQYWSNPRLGLSAKVEIPLRKRLSENISCTSNEKIFEIINNMLFEQLPICYLEGFNEINEYIEKLSWPKNPKFIFTSNSFDNDEVFKIWTANKVEKGVRYVTGQHGNNYGTYRYNKPTIEEITADRFLTWGWKDGLVQHTPSFVLKTAGRNQEKSNKGGGLLLVQDMYYHRMDTWDRSAEYSQIFSEQIKFISNLFNDPYNKLTVRLHSSFVLNNPSESEMWGEIDPQIKVDRGDSHISTLISKNRLIVYSYDSTGILESLSQNIPTLAFWQNGLEHLRDSAKQYYQALIEVGIVHLSPESASQKVNEIWHDVEAWWSKPDVQMARNIFCEVYAKKSENPVKDLRNILLAII